MQISHEGGTLTLAAESPLDRVWLEKIKRSLAKGFLSLNPSLRTTYELVSRGEWRSGDVAKTLNINPTTDCNRLEKLVALGALQRRRLELAGTVYAYSVPDGDVYQEDLDGANLVD